MFFLQNKDGIPLHCSMLYINLVISYGRSELQLPSSIKETAAIESKQHFVNLPEGNYRRKILCISFDMHKR